MLVRAPQPDTNKEEKISGLMSLPSPLFLHASLFASRRDLITLESVNKRGKSLSQEKKPWEQQFKNHFPNKYQFAKDAPQTSWKVLFQDTEEKSYTKLLGGRFSLSLSTLFICIKENDFTTFSKLTPTITLEDLDQTDGFLIKSLWDWIREKNNPDFLEHVYQTLIETRFADRDPQGKINKKTLLSWAIYCRQPIRDLITRLDVKPIALELHEAAEDGQLETVKMLATYKPGLLTRQDQNQSTALTLAVRNDHLSVVQFLLSHEVVRRGVNLRKWGGFTTIHEAKSAPVTRELIKAGAKVDNQTSGGQRQPVHSAAWEGLLAVVETLCTHNPALLTAKTAHNSTPLAEACTKRNAVALVKYLLQHVVVRAEINLPVYNYSTTMGYYNGSTPLLLAAQSGSAAIMHQLLKFGAIATHHRYDGQMALHIAVQRKDREKIDILVNHSPGLLSEKNGQGLTPQEWAIYLHDEEIAAYLASQPSMLPIHLAAQQGNNDELLRQIGLGANISASTKENQYQPSHLATIHGHLEVLKTICRLSPQSLSQPAANGFTPLMLAIMHGHYEIIEFFKTLGIQIDKSTEEWAIANNYRTALLHIGLEHMPLSMLFKPSPSSLTITGSLQTTARSTMQEENKAHSQSPS